MLIPAAPVPSSGPRPNSVISTDKISFIVLMMRSIYRAATYQVLENLTGFLRTRVLYPGRLIHTMLKMFTS